MSKKSNKVRADGRIAVQVFIGTVDGKRKYKTVYGKSQKEAEKKAVELKEKLRIGIDVLKETTPFSEYKNIWLSNKEVQVSPSYYRTILGYANVWSVFDKVPINKVREAQIQSVINDYAKINPFTHKPTAKETLTSYKHAISQIFDIAVRADAISKNYATNIIIPNSAPKKEREALSDEQIRWINDTPHRAQTAAMIMLYAGLRRGELLALMWNDIDLKNGSISINKAVEIVINKPVIKQHTKTAAGMRTVYIPNNLVNYLQSVPKNNILVCPAKSGSVMSQSAFNAMWLSYMNDLNDKYGRRVNGNPMTKFSPKSEHPMMIKTFTAHQLRHTCASMYYKAGIDVLTAKEQLGHSDIKTTLSIYTHLDSIYKQKNMSKLNSFIESASQMQVSKS